MLYLTQFLIYKLVSMNKPILIFRDNAFLLSFLFISFVSFAQQKGTTSFTEKHVVTSSHVSSLSGITHTYTRQTLNGMEIIGTESSVHVDQSGKVLAFHNNLIPNVTSFVRSSSHAMSEVQVIASVAQQMGYGTISGLTKLSKNVQSNANVYEVPNISKRDVTVKPYYYFSKDTGVIAVYEVFVYEKSAEHAYNFYVDAISGNIVYKSDLITSCSFEISGEHNHESNESHKPALANVDSFVGPLEETALVGTYNVYPLPVESPYYGSRTLVSNPEDLTASPFGWHDTNGAAGSEFTTTQGNNVRAYDDGNGTDSPSLASSFADGGAGLSFNFPLNLTYSSANQSQDAAVTNLFYWNNVLHDVLYLYGFDEASGNFQNNNYGNGGTGGDAVEAQAQDEADLADNGFNRCNANFFTPNDGSPGEMQMYICDNRDGDLDNGVIVHEFGHGISNRLTGGRFSSGCLSNSEQMGEGWGDIYGLLFTVTATNYNTVRPIGNYLIGAPTGNGIRQAPYTKDFTVNGQTYADVALYGSSSPHPHGSIWATMLWDMTVDLIDQYGFDADFYTGTGGNNIALALITEGMKLQPCSPGFVDGRDAIIAADQALYAGANYCLIWEAFARRGLGFSASQGSTNSRTDGTEAFDLPPDVGNFVATISEACISAGAVTGLSGGSPAGGTYSGPGVTDNGGTFDFDPSVPGAGITTVTYTVNTCGSLVDYTQDISVTSGIPMLVCKDVTVNLDGTGNISISNPDVVSNLASDTTNYTVDQTGVFSPETITGTTVNLGDDNATGALDIGFDFSYYGNSFTQVHIASNGFLSFDNSGTTGSASYSPDALPSTGVPNNMIAFAWNDLSPNISGIVRYATVGVAPNRKFVVDFVNVPTYTGNPPSSFEATTQVQLHEGSHRIEVHSTQIDNDGSAMTQGLENAAGNAAVIVPGRNGVAWGATNDYVAFVPGTLNNLSDNCGNSVTLSLSKQNFTCRDIGVNEIVITADDGNGGVATCTAMVTVVGETTTFTGAWDNGLPDAGKKAVFASNYDTALANVDACSCEVAQNAIVTVGAGEYMNIDGNITIEGTLVVEHQGSVVQVAEDAITVNNGTINVHVTTPTLKPRDFMVLGNPMTADTPLGLDNPIFRILNHTTANFRPHPEVQSAFPGGTNFVDEDNNDYANFSGSFIPGEGYLVWPQVNLQDGNQEYNLRYSDGTLNSGPVTYALDFNTTGTGTGSAADNKNASPSFISNPYASAISANAFMNDASNNAIDELYFWEHNSSPNNSFPGANSANFNMADISIFNNLGFNPASTGSSTSSGSGDFSISTGQGFAVKSNGSAATATFTNAMRTTGNNNTLRNPETTDRIWLAVTSNDYQLQSTTLVGFTPNATRDFDASYDSKRIGVPVSIYSHLTDGSEALAIQGREAFNNDIQVLLGFSTQIDKIDAPYTIAITDLDGLHLEAAAVYLKDNYTGVITNLSETDYTFTSSMGTFNARFTLQFEGEEVLNTNDLVLESVSLFPNPASESFTIVSPNAMIESIVISDVLGRTVLIQGSNNTSQVIDIATLQNATYLVKINTVKGSIVKQLVKE